MHSAILSLLFLSASLHGVVADCFDGLCSNGATCVDILAASPTTNNSACLCPPNYTGKTCAAGVYNWSAATFASCSATCGGGYQVGTRQCKDIVTGQTVADWLCGTETIGQVRFGNKIVRICNTGPCPVWSAWSNWSASSTLKTCGMGVSTRSRTCLYGGTPNVDAGCVGPSTDIQYVPSISCDLMDAPIQLLGSSSALLNEGLVLVYDNTKNLWGSVCFDGFDLSAARIVCKNLGMAGAYAVASAPLYTPLLFTNVRCVGTESTLQSCQHDGPSTCSGSVNVSCVTNGFWSTWSAWSSCSATCGGGVQTRSRTCTGPYNGGLPCPDSAQQSQPCNTQPCPQPGMWSDWSAWSPCSTACGGGISFRNRTCNMTTYGSQYTLPCVGDSEQNESCNTNPCYSHSCTALRQSGQTTSGFAVIDPDGALGPVQPLQVYCDMTINDAVGTTIISIMNSSSATVAGYNASNPFEALVQYGNDTWPLTLAQVVALINVSGTCEQYISWKCNQSAFRSSHGLRSGEITR